jgi:integrase family protein
MKQIHSATSKRKWKQLTEKDRHRLEDYFNTGMKTQEIAERMGYSKRTIERERALGLTEQLKPVNKSDALQKQWVYLADVAQRRHEENSAHKGRPLKIENDHRLMEHIESKIKNEKWSPAAILGDIEQKGWPFDTRICVKTLYNYINRELFLGISNKEL